MRVLVIAGAAGTGKTTLGRALARELAIPLLDLDTLTESLLDGLAAWLPDGEHWNAPRHRGAVRPARYAALLATLSDQVAAGIGAVAVAPFTAELAGGAEWDALVAAAGGEPTVIRLVATPELLAERRAGRAVARDAHAMPAAPEIPVVATLDLDAHLSTEQQLTRVRRALGLHEPLPERSPVFEREFLAGLSDLDGTLIDSTPAVLRSWSRLAAELGYDGDMLSEGHGRPARQILEMLLPPDLVESAFLRIAELEVAEVSDVHAIPGSLDFFAAIPARAIVTSGTQAIASSRIAAAGVPRPESVVTFDDVAEGKPHPEPFLRAAELLGVPGEACLALEDAPAGIASAHAAGCTVIAITGTHSRDELAEAELIVDRLDQLEVVAGERGFRVRPRR